MSTIQLSDEELDELERLIEQHSKEMLVEIHRTENKEFRQELENRRHSSSESSRRFGWCVNTKRLRRITQAGGIVPPLGCEKR